MIVADPSYGLVDTCEQKVRPASERGVEQMRRLLGDQLPDWSFAALHDPVLEGGVGFVAVGEDEGDQAIRHPIPKLARQAVARGIRGRLTGPALLDDVAEFGAVGMLVEGCGRQDAQDEVAPAGEERRAGVE